MSSFKIISPSKEVLCPFCHHKFHLSEKVYREETDDESKKVSVPQVIKAFGMDQRILNEVKECPEVSDPSFSSHLRILTKTPLVRRFINVKTNGVKFGREKKAYWTCCPQCGLRLPKELGDGDSTSKTIAIIGLTGSGKSCFFTKLMEELPRCVEVGYNVISLKTVKLMGGGIDPIQYVDSAKLFRERYDVNYACENGKNVKLVPDHTKRIAENNVQVRIPFIYRLQNNKKKVDLLFYDPSGEDIGDDGVFNRSYNYAAHASGVIFIVDPLAYDGLRNCVEHECDVADPRNPIDAYYRLLQDNNKLDKDGKVKVPCAVVLSKFDLLTGKIPKGVGEPGVSHIGGYNRKYYDDLHTKINDFLTGQNVPLTENTLGNTLDNFRLFAASALGGTPVPFTNEKGIERKKYPENPKPFGVVAPLLWLLYEFGFLSESENQATQEETQCR